MRVPKMGLSFLALYSTFHFPQRRCVLVLGGWVGGVAWGVGGSARSAPRSPAPSPQITTSLLLIRIPAPHRFGNPLQPPV